MVSLFLKSHTRTVVREYCKDDDQCQWERPKFDPPPSLNPLPIVTKIYLRDYVVDIYHNAKFHPDRIRGFVSAHAQARFRASNCLLGYFFVFLGVLHLVYSQDARTDFDAKYVKRCGSAQGRAFWGSQNQKLSFSPLFAFKTAILGPFFDVTSKFLLENAFNIGHVLSKRPLIVIVAP